MYPDRRFRVLPQCLRIGKRGVDEIHLILTLVAHPDGVTFAHLTVVSAAHKARSIFQ